MELPEGYSKTREAYPLGEEGPDSSDLTESTDRRTRVEVEAMSIFCSDLSSPAALIKILFSVEDFLMIWSSREPQIIVLVREDWEGLEDPEPSVLEVIP